MASTPSVELTVPPLTTSEANGGEETAMATSPGRGGLAPKSAKLSAVSPRESAGRSTTMPWASSLPATVAATEWPSAKARRSWVAPSTAWALVTTSPSPATKPAATPGSPPARPSAVGGRVTTLTRDGAARSAIAP